MNKFKKATYIIAASLFALSISMNSSAGEPEKGGCLWVEIQMGWCSPD